MQAIVCRPHGGLRLTRAACAKRHKSSVSEYGSRNQAKVFSESCSTCELGAAHLRGESPSSWPDGTPVREVELIPAGALLRSEPARRRPRGRKGDLSAVG